MKTIVLFFLFLSVFSHAQQIKGTVVDETGHTMADVSIYLDGTTTGTVSEANGSFTLTLSTSSHGNLVFRKEGYETFATSLQDILHKSLKVVMTRTHSIEEIRLVPYTSEAYQNHIHYFLDTSIGYDRENVRIRNQRSLKFSYDKKSKLLKVKAPETLIIDNKNLGYEIHYNLISYTSDFNSKMVNYTGTSFFKETKKTPRVRVNRMNAYNGSLLHFFRSIFNNMVSADGFIVNQAKEISNPKYPTEEELNMLNDYVQMMLSSKIVKIPEHISDISHRKNSQTPYLMAITKTLIPDTDYIQRTNGKVFLDFKDILQVNYPKYLYEMKGKEIIRGTGKIVLSSLLHTEADRFEVSDDGNISTPDQLITEGDFSKNKIENMLPLDYQSGD
ncbi:carboxypeptidase-like regulatory domain-containing protein [Chryseobacterium pennipullorum]|uniref:Carboxypeptidase-like regulatory domain-containing protein n=1 Tax=Chryseobacterium pennipullorum TaxID=2258963 RepID=A0A3D9B4M3_9FLAO|nr:carboxypeptidase-like regulatory domain-containing protein [Chryseobacterium pennipullorum]REC48631.1 hypothetical protein DRF67_07400 [Chryseobacterium pennipullorum]